MLLTELLVSRDSRGPEPRKSHRYEPRHGYVKDKDGMLIIQTLFRFRMTHAHFCAVQHAHFCAVRTQNQPGSWLVCIVSFGQGSSLLWTHTLRAYYSRPIALTQEGRSLVNNVCECVRD